MELCEHESLARVNGLRALIQDDRSLPFGTDALLLAACLRKRSGKAAELGAGSGIVSLLASGRRLFSHITAIEIRHDMADILARNIVLNRSDEATPIEALECDVRKIPAERNGSCVCVFSNPPYMEENTGIPGANEADNASRREINGGIGDFCRAAARLLVCRGSFFCVFRPERLPDLFSAMRENGIEPKRLIPVFPDELHPPCLVICEGIKAGGKTLCVSPPLILWQNGRESDDYAYITREGKFPEKFM